MTGRLLNWVILSVVQECDSVCCIDVVVVVCGIGDYEEIDEIAWLLVRPFFTCMSMELVYYEYVYGTFVWDLN